LKLQHGILEKISLFKDLSDLLKFDNLAKSLEIVMPDLIRHPERIEFTGFRLSPE